MAVKKRKGDAGCADQLWSAQIRARGQCERCGDTAGPFDAAHIVGRQYATTRCDLRNGWCLCKPCHHEVDAFPDVFMRLVRKTPGEPTYRALVKIAKNGAGIRVKWADVAAHLRMVARYE